MPINDRTNLIKLPYIGALDDFEAALAPDPAGTAAPAPLAPGFGAPGYSPAPTPGESEAPPGLPPGVSGEDVEGFAKGIEEFLKQLHTNPEFMADVEKFSASLQEAGLDGFTPPGQGAEGSAGAGPPPDFAKEMENLTRMMMGANVGPDGGPVGTAGPGAPPLDPLAMLNESAKAAAGTGTSNPGAPGGEDAMAAMMNALANMNGEEGGAGEPGAENNMVNAIMRQVLCRAVLYEPMESMAVLYPIWLAKNKEDTPKEDYDRYTKQYDTVLKIKQVFDEEHSAATSTSTSQGQTTDGKEEPFEELSDAGFEKVLVLMKDLQELGQPPQEILTELTPEGAEDGAGAIPGMPPLGGGGGNGPPPECCVM